MSRIHEALKKAEQERAAVQTTGATVLTEPPAGKPATPATTAPDSEGAAFSANRSGDCTFGWLPAIR